MIALMTTRRGETVPTKQVYACIGALLLLLSVGCARSAKEALPGDSVGEDGSIKLSPPSPVILPSAAAKREELGAVERRVFPPELIMENQLALGVSAAQRTALDREIAHAQTETVRLQWELQAEKEKLVALLEAEPIDEAQVSAAAARVMDRESRVKATHLTMLVRVKNLLTAPQRAKLRALREPACADAAPRAGARDN